MKILIINEFAHLSGAEQMANNQYELFYSKGHTVNFLCFSLGTAKENIDRYDVIRCKNIVNKLVFNPFLYIKMRLYIKRKNPDKILVNSMWSSPLTQYVALKGYEVYQIIHDYYPVCPTSLCVRDGGDENICEGYKCHKCIKQCKENGSKIQLLIKYWMMKPYEIVRKKYIKKFIAPSKRLCMYLNLYGYKCECINNPLSNIEELREKVNFTKHSKKYVYIGGINKHKGILDFLNVFIVFAEGKNVVLDIYGEITEKSIRPEFFSLINRARGKVEYHGVVSNQEVRNAITIADFLIVPSRWMDNYPTCVLEAMACGTVVIGSDRGGIPEMIEGTGIIFNFSSANSLINALEQSFLLSKQKYMYIRKKAHERVLKDNTYEGYYFKMMQLFGEYK